VAVTSHSKDPFHRQTESREWDWRRGEKRVRKWAGAEDRPHEKLPRRACLYDAENKDKLQATSFCRVVIDESAGRFCPASPCMAAGRSCKGRAGA